MAEYKLADKAERDLEEITSYTLQQWGSLQTITYLDGLEHYAQLLADSPELGVRRDALADGLLSFPYESHVLYYFKQPHGVTIVRVLHNRMDPINHL